MLDFFGYALIAIGSLLIAGNWSFLLTGRSLAPGIGGLTATYGLENISHEAVQSWWWLPLLVDPGCALFFALVTVNLIANRSRPNSSDNAQD